MLTIEIFVPVRMVELENIAATAIYNQSFIIDVKSQFNWTILFSGVSALAILILAIVGIINLYRRKKAKSKSKR